MLEVAHRIDRRSPLAGRSIAMTPFFEAKPAPAMRRWSLRTRARDAARIGEAMEMTLDVPLLRSVRYDGFSVLRLSPDEWMLLCPDDAMGIEQRLSAAPTGVLSAVDVSHRQTAIIVSGASCVHILSTYCPLDFELSSFPVGGCTRTVFARSEVLLWRLADTAFHLEVWRSFSDYVWRGLERAGEDLRFEDQVKGTKDGQ